MKVLVAGAGGQVGRATVEGAPADIEIVAATHRDLDITKASDVMAFVGAHSPALIVNAAAYTQVDDAETEPRLAHAVNADGARNLARAASANGARMIHLSTDFVFDGNASSPYRPDDHPAPLGVYGASKLEGEKAVSLALPQSAIVLRTAWVYAPAGRNFMLTILHKARELGMVRVVDDQRGTPTCARSIAAAIWAFARHDELSGIFHWTDAGTASWFDFAVAIVDDACALGLLETAAEVVAISTADFPTPAARPRYSVLDTQKTIEAIDLAPASWRDNLRETLSEIAHA